MTITLGSKLPFAAKVTMVRFEPSLLFACVRVDGLGMAFPRPSFSDLRIAGCRSFGLDFLRRRSGLVARTTPSISEPLLPGMLGFCSVQGAGLTGAANEWRDLRRKN
jgi:hypothetical protein